MINRYSITDDVNISVICDKLLDVGSVFCFQFIICLMKNDRYEKVFSQIFSNFNLIQFHKS